MYELGVVIEIIKMVEDLMDKVVIQIGEFSWMIPKYIEVCYTAAVDVTL